MCSVHPTSNAPRIPAHAILINVVADIVNSVSPWPSTIGLPSREALAQLLLELRRGRGLHQGIAPALVDAGLEVGDRRLLVAAAEPGGCQQRQQHWDWSPHAAL